MISKRVAVDSAAGSYFVQPLMILYFPLFSGSDSDDFTAYCLILPMLGIGPQWWVDSHNIHHVVCNDVHCGELVSSHG